MPDGNSGIPESNDAIFRAAFETYKELCAERHLKPLPYEVGWTGEYNRMLVTRPLIKDVKTGEPIVAKPVKDDTPMGNRWVEIAPQTYEMLVNGGSLIRYASSHGAVAMVFVPHAG